MTAPEDERARRGFIALNAVRIASIMAVLAGIVISQRAGGLIQYAGMALAFGGLAAFFFVPKRLARRWRSPEEDNSGGRPE